MSISEKLTKLNTDISNAYNSIETKGGTVPVNKNTENLASAIESIEGVAIYTVTFDSDGGTEVAEQIIVSGQTAKEPTSPSKTDYIFSGWLLNGEPFDFETPITENITLVAKWYQQQVNYQMLYDYGNECVDITDGWANTVFVPNSSSKGEVIKYSNHMAIGGLRATAYTNRKVNLADYKKMVSLKAYTKGRTDKTEDNGCQWFIATEELSIGNGLLNSDWAFTWKETYNKYREGTSGYQNFISDMTVKKSSSGNIPIELNEDYYIGIMYDGMPNTTLSNGGFIDLYNLILCKQDNWEELCTLAGLTSSDYTDEATLCADSTAISTILNNKEAVKYMIYNCTGSFMAEFIASSTALTNLNDSTYKTLIHANEHWSKFLNMVA